MSLRLAAPVLLIALSALACAASAKAAPAAAVPEVIAPAELPALQAIRSDGIAAPAAVRGDYRPAPMPDADSAAPVAVADDQPGFAPAFYSDTKSYLGDGFSNGSSADSVHASQVKATPGLALNVPLN